ncbi:GatB/YqeY domain-containing protein [soil metagenome]
MSLAEQIQRDTKEAMKSRDRQRSSALRMLSAALQNAELDDGEPLSQDEQESVLRSQLKQREESAEAYRKAGRDEQAERESAEAEIVRGYLPEPPSKDELEAIVDRAIQETGAVGVKDMGSVMGRAMELAEGRAEGRQLSALVRMRLQQ